MTIYSKILLYHGPLYSEALAKEELRIFFELLIDTPFFALPGLGEV